MYEDVSIRKEHAIQKIHRVINEEARHGSMSVVQAHRITTVGNKTDKNTEITPKFLDVFKEIPVSANRQLPDQSNQWIIPLNKRGRIMVY